jgi:glycosyltransferase involved in cell wall biosynthesis
VSRLRILIWHIHGSYLDAITGVEHDWYLPVREGHYEGRRFSSPPWVHEVPFDQVRDLDLDLVIYQSPQNLFSDALDTLSSRQRRLPAIYLEHNTPKSSPSHTRHPVDDPSMLLVHVTHFNRTMWDSGRTPVRVIEHTVAIDRAIRYSSELERGLTAVNGPQYRPRIAGLDLFLEARARVPLDLCGIDTEELGGLGDIKYFGLHERMAQYRFLYSPMRYTSLPLAVIEAMTVGMPIVALATTEVPSVLRDGVHGFISNDNETLVRGMRCLLEEPELAAEMGRNARQLAEARFGLERFRAEWNEALVAARALRT